MKLTRSRVVRTLLVSAALLFACANPAESKTRSKKGSVPAAAPAPEGHAQVVGAPGAPAVPTSQGAAVNEKSYAVAVVVPDKVASGKQGTVHVSVTPKPGWKLNEDFPTKLTVTAPSGVTVDKAKQRKGDAKHFSKKKGEFDVTFTSASAGDKKFDATFKFAVCTESSCDPKKVALKWVVSVE